MPSESTILEVRADEVRVGDSLLTSAPAVSWMHVDEAKPITSRATGEVVWIEFRGFEDSGEWWERARLERTVIVRRSAPSPSGAEEAASAIRWARAVCVDHGSAEIADALREYCAWAWAAPSAGARKPGGEPEVCTTFPAGYLPMDCPCCGRRRLEYGVNADGGVVYVKCEKCGADSEGEALTRKPGGEVVSEAAAGINKDAHFLGLLREAGEQAFGGSRKPGGEA